MGELEREWWMGREEKVVRVGGSMVEWKRKVVRIRGKENGGMKGGGREGGREGEWWNEMRRRRRREGLKREKGRNKEEQERKVRMM